MSIAFLEGDFAPPTPQKKGVAWLAWIVIVLAVGAVVFGQQLLPAIEDEDAAADSKGEALDLILVKLQARYIVGAANLLEQQKAEVLEQSKMLDRGSTRQRLAYVTLIGELGGPKAAFDALDKLRLEQPARSVEERDVFDILRRLYIDLQAKRWLAPSLDQKQKDLLRTELDWFGDLALGPREVASRNPALRDAALAPARRTFHTILGLVVGGMMIGFFGLGGLVFLLAMARRGLLRGRLRTGLPHAGVYAETFALWMLFFVGLSVAAQWLPDSVPRLLRTAVGMLGSLVVLAWPCLRGIPWSQVRKDVGLTWGRPLLEPVLGLATYAMTLPILAVGLVITLIILTVQRQLPLELGQVAPGAQIRPHPLFEYMAHGDWTVWLQVFFLASIVAPLVEETMFRGVLYRHLREATRRLSTFASIFVSALIVSFLFAIVHPTGIAAVPMLMSLAIGFTLAREWRGSLIPSMIAHATSNAIVTLVALLCLSD